MREEVIRPITPSPFSRVHAARHVSPPLSFVSFAVSDWTTLAVFVADVSLWGVHSALA